MEDPEQIFILQLFHSRFGFSSRYVHLVIALRARVGGALASRNQVMVEGPVLRLRSPEVIVDDADGILEIVERLHMLQTQHIPIVT